MHWTGSVLVRQRVEGEYKMKKSKAPNPLKADPTRTGLLRRKFMIDMARRFTKLKQKINQLIVVEDALGLAPRGKNPLLNMNPNHDELGRFAESSAGPALKFVKPGKVNPQYSSAKLAEVDVSKLDEAWSKDSMYVGPAGEGKTSIGGRYENAKTFLKQAGASGQEVEASVVYFDEKTGEVSFEDGRHRFAALRDMGYTGGTVALITETPKGREKFLTKYGKSQTNNVFCPTGPGGGVDPSCSPSNITAVVDTESKYETRFMVGSKEFFVESQKDEEGWHVGFGEPKNRGGNTAAMTHDPNTSSVQVLTKVQAHLENFIEKKQPKTILFTAEKYEESRVAVYDRLSKRMGNAYGYTLTVKDYPAIREYVLDKNPTANQLTINTRWKFRTNAQKLALFTLWLKQQIEEGILPTRGPDDDPWTAAYAEEAYKRAHDKAFDVVRKPALARKMNFYDGTKAEFLKSSFGRPASIDRVKLLASRSYEDLKGVTAAMSTKMARTLADGMLKGLSPRDVARHLNADVDGIGRSRALVIARTETIRAHAEGALDAMEALGVTDVGVAVEWSTADDPHVCPLCQPLEGLVLTIEQARGMFPRHPNCRCSPIPANVGEDDEDQSRTAEERQAALDESIDAEKPKRGERTTEEQKERSSWGGADSEFEDDAPESIFEGEDIEDE